MNAQTKERDLNVRKHRALGIIAKSLTVIGLLLIVYLFFINGGKPGIGEIVVVIKVMSLAVIIWVFAAFLYIMQNFLNAARGTRKRIIWLILTITLLLTLLVLVISFRPLIFGS